MLELGDASTLGGRNVLAEEMAAREMGGLSLADALSFCELLGRVDPARFERAALHWLHFV